MSRTSQVVLTLIGVVLAILFVIGAIYGPGLYQKSKAFVGPIVEISQSEERLAELNAEMPFTEPDDGVVAEDRLMVFFEVRRALQPRYRQWNELEQALEEGEEDWQAAAKALEGVRSLMKFQIDTLRQFKMSPAEFIWLEDLAYDTWFSAINDRLERSVAAEAVRRSTEEDLAALTDLRQQRGSSAALRAFEDRLQQRLDRFVHPEAPEVDGVAPATAELFWSHRRELAELDLSAFSEMHRIIRGGDSVNIEVDPSS